MENLELIALIDQISRPKQDLSDLLARIDIACVLLEMVEPGLWYDFELSRRRLCHPEVSRWMQLYEFCDLAQLPPEALTAFCLSVERHLDRLQALPSYPDKALP